MEIFIIACLILLNGLLSLSEIALVSARKTRLETDAKKGVKSAKTALKLTQEPDRFLSTIQIGITLIGILTGVFSGESFAVDFAETVRQWPLLAPYAMGISKAVIVIIVTYFTLVFGELVPKRLGMTMPERVSKIAAAPMILLSYIAAPMVWLLSKSTSIVVKILGIKPSSDNKITEEEIKAIIKEGYHTGEVQEVEHEIVSRVFSLDDRDVSSIMTHRNNLVLLDISDTKEFIFEKIKQHPHNAYPVISEKFENVLGVVYLKDLFGCINVSDFSLEKCIQTANYLPETQTIYHALEQFKNTRTKLGIVTDEFGFMQGIITLKDIMEALVGDVLEADEEQAIVDRGNGSWLVDGQYSFYNFLEYFNMEDLYSEHDYNTLSGLILETLEHLPKTGEKFSWNAFEFEIVDMDGARIDKVLVRLKA